MNRPVKATLAAAAALALMGTTTTAISSPLGISAASSIHTAKGFELTGHKHGHKKWWKKRKHHHHHHHHHHRSKKKHRH